VPRAVINVEHEIAHRHRVTIIKPAIWFEGLCMHAPLPPVVVKLCDPEAVGFVRAFDRHAQFFGKDTRLPAMIEMSVREQDFLDRHALLLCRSLETIEIAARIGKRAAHRFGAPDQAAILLERRDRNDGGLKGWGDAHAVHLASVKGDCKEGRVSTASSALKKIGDPKGPPTFFSEVRKD
jgi:hypothetical protein